MTAEYARDVRFLEGAVRLILPGTWVNLPISDPEAAVAYAKRFVKRQVGPADRLARTRREAVLELVGTMRSAAEHGVHTYLMSLEMLPGVPFPAAVLMTDQEWPEAAADARAEGDLAAALRAAVPSGEVAMQRTGPQARTVEMADGKIGDSGEELLTMRLEYYVPYPDGAKLLVARVNVPNIPSAEPFATLFDEILGSVVFMEQEGQEQAQGTVPTP